MIKDLGAKFYLCLFEEFLGSEYEGGNCKRYEQEFIKAMGIKNPDGLAVKIFDAFVAGIDTYQEALSVMLKAEDILLKNKGE